MKKFNPLMSRSNFELNHRHNRQLVNLSFLIVSVFLIAWVVGFISGYQYHKEYNLSLCWCIGHTKFEYGRAIDCQGDTIPIKEFREHYKEYLKSQQIKKLPKARLMIDSLGHITFPK